MDRLLVRHLSNADLQALREQWQEAEQSVSKTDPRHEFYRAMLDLIDEEMRRRKT
jgi:hypothetical protein